MIHPTLESREVPPFVLYNMYLETFSYYFFVFYLGTKPGNIDLKKSYSIPIRFSHLPLIPSLS